jgi:hypothetical protein
MKYTFNDFIKLFNLNKTISFADFSKQISVLNGSDTSGQFVVRSDLDTFINRVSKKDDRKQRLTLYKQKLYKMLVQEPEVALKAWFDKTVALNEDIDFYFDIPDATVFGNNTFAGRTNSKYGRLCKNINFEKFYGTKKLYTNDFEYTFGLMKVMFEDFKIRNSLVGPAFFDHICKIDDNYNQVWIDFMIGCNRASIFNPATYKGIMEELFEGDTIYAPCMGWNAYQLGFYSTNWKHFIATDVIPEVVDNGNRLHAAWQEHANKSMFELQDKTVDLYCCPSEQIDLSKYANKVDAVLFSPPYFDLEIYDSPDQSFSNFPNYDDWLKGYWEETVLKAKAVLRKGGRFAFVISNYRNKAKEEVTISQDMKAVVEKHLTNIGHYRVEWNTISTGRQAKKMRNGNFEDLWLFEKN